MNDPARIDFVLPAGWWRVDQDWRRQAACVEADLDLFYKEGRSEWAEIEEAKAICRGCPVREECLTYALDSQERYGIWGGLTATERLMILRSRRARKGLRSVQLPAPEPETT